jgi:hypothetical protein
MEQIRLERLGLLDLGGKPMDLGRYLEKYLLLIFLRHLA